MMPANPASPRPPAAPIALPAKKPFAIVVAIIARETPEPIAFTVFHIESLILAQTSDTSLSISSFSKTPESFSS